MEMKIKLSEAFILLKISQIQRHVPREEQLKKILM